MAPLARAVEAMGDFAARWTGATRQRGNEARYCRIGMTVPAERAIRRARTTVTHQHCRRNADRAPAASAGRVID
jgi:hypothetical protein